jgi:hypothetical protein
MNVYIPRAIKAAADMRADTTIPPTWRVKFMMQVTD